MSTETQICHKSPSRDQESTYVFKSNFIFFQLQCSCAESLIDFKQMTITFLFLFLNTVLLYQQSQVEWFEKATEGL